MIPPYVERRFAWNRVAITEDQSATLRAKGIEPIIKHDNRYKDKHEHEAYEAEALGQAELTRIVTGILDALLPEPLDRVLEREEAERKEKTERLKK